MHLDRDSGWAVAAWAQACARGKRAGRRALAIELLYDRGRLAVTPPTGCVPTIIEVQPTKPMSVDFIA